MLHVKKKSNPIERRADWRPPPRELVPESYGCKFEFRAEFLLVVYSSSINENGLSHVSGEVFWFELFEFFPLSCNHAAVGVFQTFDGRRGIVNFVCEYCFGYSDGYGIEGSNCCTFF